MIKCCVNNVFLFFCYFENNNVVNSAKTINIIVFESKEFYLSSIVTKID